MRKIVTKFSKDGNALFTLACYEEEMLPPLSEGESYIDGGYNDKYFLVNGKIIDKPTSKIIFTGTKTGTKLKNIPNPTTVTITGYGTTFKRVITDGTYKFSVDMPGEYTVKCEPGIELPIEFKVTMK